MLDLWVKKSRSGEKKLSSRARLRPHDEERIDRYLLDPCERGIVESSDEYDVLWA